MDYKQKYLKYKKKYGNLKLQIGSGPHMDKLTLKKKAGPSFKDLVESLAEYFNYHTFENLFLKYLTNELLDELRKLDKLTLEAYKSENDEIFSQISSISNIDTYHKYSDHHKEILRILFDVIVQHNCTVEEFMTYNDSFDPNIHCKNTSLVKGSCGAPGFFDTLNNDTFDADNPINYINLFDKIKQKLIPGQSIGIIIGATNTYDSTCNINLYFNPCFQAYLSLNEGLWSGCDDHISFDDILHDIDNNPLKYNYKIKSRFPLNTGPNSLIVLNKILELTKEYRITLINQMCGSCFRSFYYLKQKATQNFIYRVQPEQGLSSEMDSDQIRNCFTRSR